MYLLIINQKQKKGKSVADNYFYLPLLKDNNDEGEKNKSITFRSAFNKKFTLYYKGIKLDEANMKNINNVLFPKGEKLKRGDELKKHKDTCSVNIFWPQGSQEKVLVKYSEFENKKEFEVELIYREIEMDKLVKKFKNGEKIIKPNEFSNEDLEDSETLEKFNSLYGEPQNITVETPQELEKYCKSAYYRIAYTVPEFWVEANPTAKGKLMDCGFKAYCVCIDIVNIKTKNENNASANNNVFNKMYKTLALKNKETVKKQSDDNNSKESSSNETEENSDEYDIEEVEVSDSGSEEEEIVVKKSSKTK